MSCNEGAGSKANRTCPAPSANASSRRTLASVSMILSTSDTSLSIMIAPARVAIVLESESAEIYNAGTLEAMAYHNAISVLPPPGCPAIKCS